MEVTAEQTGDQPQPVMARGKPYFWFGGGAEIARAHVAFVARIAPQWMPFTRRRWRQAARTMVRRG
jgi:hypothetical protein